ncbi:MAG TPA: c-type cytochrome biogenesis protein CcsB [Chloroflexia bacterium]|nr:c-type cytochrome biogenesis protein CcsB [Chloroflexia bacterium]
MGFDAPTFGFNEPTLTIVAYLGYLFAFLFFCAHLMTRSGRALLAPRSQVTLAGAGAGAGVSGSMDIDIDGQAEGSARGVSYSPVLGRIGSGLVLFAWLSLGTALAMRWVHAGHPPYVTLYEIATMLVFGITTVYLVLFEGVLKTRALGAFVVLLIFCLHSYAVWFIPTDLKRTIELVPALRSNWLLIHVSMAIISYSAFAAAAGAGLTYLAKHHLKGRIAAALPSGAAIEEFMYRAVAVGFPFVTLVLITGAIWAQEAWTKAWSWDPKEVWALITWLTYAAYLHVRVQRGVRNVTMAWLSLIGFAVVMFTFMGVNYLVEWFGLQSMHTYSIDSGRPPGLSVASIGTVVVFVVLLLLAFVSWLRVKFPGKRSPRK